MNPYNDSSVHNNTLNLSNTHSRVKNDDTILVNFYTSSFEDFIKNIDQPNIGISKITTEEFILCAVIQNNINTNMISDYNNNVYKQIEKRLQNLQKKNNRSTYFFSEKCEYVFRKELVSKLKETKVINIEAQKLIAKAIFNEKFGAEKEMLKALATSLGTMEIIDPDAQFYITAAIYDKKFGEDKDVLKALATSLGTMKITDPDAQFNIAEAIYDKKFGEDKDVLKALATSLGTMKITDSEAQRYIAKAIFEKKFGENVDVLKALAKSLSTMNINHSGCQLKIADINIDNITYFNEINTYCDEIDTYFDKKDSISDKYKRIILFDKPIQEYNWDTFLKHKAITKIQKAFYKHVNERLFKASNGLRAKLSSISTKIENIDQLKVDDVLVVSAAEFANWDKHGYFCKINEITNDSIKVTQLEGVFRIGCSVGLMSLLDFNKLPNKEDDTIFYDSNLKTLYTYRNGKLESYESKMDLTGFESKLQKNETIHYGMLSTLFKPYTPINNDNAKHDTIYNSKEDFYYLKDSQAKHLIEKFEYLITKKSIFKLNNDISFDRIESSFISASKNIVHRYSMLNNCNHIVYDTITLLEQQRKHS